MENTVCCSICTENEHDSMPVNQRMITKCNHYFHKHCFYRANYGKTMRRCPNCRTPSNADDYTKEVYAFTEIPQDMQDHIEILSMLQSKLKMYNPVISGSFASYLYQKLKRIQPAWNFTNIDLFYYGEKIDTKDNSIIVPFNGNIVIDYTNVNGNDTDRQEYNNLLEHVSKLMIAEIFVNDDNPSVKRRFSIFARNINCRYKNIQMYMIKPYRFIEEFDIHCNKISFRIYRNMIKFYIHNDYYIDGYSFRNSLVPSDRANIFRDIKKYRERGFQCINIECYDEQYWNSYNEEQDTESTISSPDRRNSSNDLTIYNIDGLES